MKTIELGFGEYVEQGCDEFVWLWNNYLSKIERNYFLEIGVHYGGMTKVGELLGFKNGIGIDFDFRELKVDFEDNITLLNADSHDKETEDKVKELLGDNKLDFLWIDGFHSYNQVSTDFTIYEKFVKPGGVIGFHDMFLGNDASDNNPVEVFFNSIKDKYNKPNTYKNDHTGVGAFFK